MKFSQSRIENWKKTCRAVRIISLKVEWNITLQLNIIVAFSDNKTTSRDFPEQIMLTEYADCNIKTRYVGLFYTKLK